MESESFEQEYVAKVLLDKISNNSRSIPHLSGVPDSVFNWATRTISSLWTNSTWKERARLYNRMREFAAENRISHLPLGMQAVAFVSSKTTTTLVSSRVTYASHLRSLLHHLNVKTPLLDLYSRSLPLSGSTLPEHQAVPCPRDLAYSLVDEVNRSQHHPDIAALLYLMRKTASRWSDILGLTGSSLVKSLLDQDPPHIVIFWGSTKTNRALKIKPWMWTVVAERERPDLLKLVVELFRNTPQHRPLTELTTDNVTRLLRLDPRAKRLNLSSYSFRRGATEELVKAAVEERIDSRVIPLLLKHNDALHQFPASTLRYAPDKVQLALMLGTQKATLLL